MPSEKDNILEFNQYMKSDKMPYIIYADIKSLITYKQIDVQIIQKTIRKTLGEHIPCGYAMWTIFAFDQIEKKYTLHCGKDYMKTFCEFLRKHAQKYNWFWKEKKISLNKRRTKITST